MGDKKIENGEIIHERNDGSVTFKSFTALSLAQILIKKGIITQKDIDDEVINL